MKNELIWKNKNEEAAYNIMKQILPQLKKMELHDTHCALKLLLLRREEKGNWNWELFEDFNNLFINEFSMQDDTYREGIKILKGILSKTFEVKKRKGKLFNLKAIQQSNKELEILDNSLGIIIEKVHETEDTQIFIMLCGLGHIIRFQTIQEFAAKRIHSWANPAIPDKKRRLELIEDFITIKNKGLDNKADSRHIRNAFAHAHFKFIDHETITIWDTDAKGIETYKCILNTGDFLNIMNMFEKKLRLVTIYPEILIMRQSLYKTFKKEWRKKPS